ncbi:hypothetical protein EVAR_10537_1 [Eumeta japonica]|uniref:Uncharacterized protein n=1 Tax=Eumeta variegata TaxID=151549 RepID=A0A4C1TKZ3_EUMVA|nr:hypothetical protein EVAR_10537_1 [Eumeta japonica]
MSLAGDRLVCRPLNIERPRSTFNVYGTLKRSLANRFVSDPQHNDEDMNLLTLNQHSPSRLQNGVLHHNRIRSPRHGPYGYPNSYIQCAAAHFIQDGHQSAEWSHKTK